MLEAIKAACRSLVMRRRNMRPRRTQLADANRGLEMAQAKIAELNTLKNLAKEAHDDDLLAYANKRLAAYRNLQADYQVTKLGARRR